MSLNGGKAKTLIPGYTIQLCTREQLIDIRDKVEPWNSEKPFTPEEEEELGRMFADGWMRRKKPPTKPKALAKKEPRTIPLTWAVIALLVTNAASWEIHFKRGFEKARNSRPTTEQVSQFCRDFTAYKLHPDAIGELREACAWNQPLILKP